MPAHETRFDSLDFENPKHSGLLDIFRTRLVGLGPFSGLFAQILKITGNYVGLGDTKMYHFEPAST